MLSQHHLSCFVSLKNPLFSSLFSLSSHLLIPALPSSRNRAVNLRQWQTPTRKPAILIPLCISIMEQLDMRALLSGPSWLTACCIPSVNKEKRGRSGETRGGEKRRGGGLRFSYHSNGINGCVGLKLAPDDSGGLTVFLSVIGRFPPHYSVSFSQSLPPPLTFYPPSLHCCSLFLDLFHHFCLNNPPTHQSPLHYFPLWIQFSRQHDVQIKECNGSWRKYTAREQ